MEIALGGRPAGWRVLDTGPDCRPNAWVRVLTLDPSQDLLWSMLMLLFSSSYLPLLLPAGLHDAYCTIPAIA